MIHDAMSFRKGKDTVELGTWWWPIQGVQEACGIPCNDMLDFLEKNNVSEIYLAIGGMTLDGEQPKEGQELVTESEVRSFVRDCSSRDIRVAGLIGISGEGTKKWLDPENGRTQFNEYAEKVFKYNQKSNDNEKLYAIHLDVEPHTIKDFLEKRSHYIQQMADFAFYATQLCKEHGLQAEYDLFAGFEHDDVAYDNKGTVRNIVDIVTSLCNSIGVMAYRNSAVHQMAFGPSKYMPYAIKNDCRLIVGAETMPTQEGVPTKITYSSVGPQEFLKEQEKLRKILDSSDCKNFSGAIHHAHSWYSFMNA
ncbi:MAG: hypothetical protein RR497_04290 [Oscillospiraceae bacterium]